MKKTILLAAAALAMLAGIATAPAFARHGADDPAGHDRNDDRGLHGRNHK